MYPLNPLLSLIQKKVQDIVGRKPVLGLDFGRAGVKIVFLEKLKEQAEPRLKFFFYPHFVGSEEPSSLHAFQAFLKQEGLAHIPVACNIEDPSLKIRSLDLPKMPTSDLNEALKWQLRDLTEDPVGKYLVRHTLLQTYRAQAGERLTLIVYAIHREAVEKRIRLLAQLSLKPRLIEPTPVAFLSCLDRVLPWAEGAVYGLLDLGESHSSFIAMSDRKLFFSRPLVEISGGELIRVIMRELSVSEVEAKGLKEKLVQNGGSGSEERLQSILSNFYSRVAIEVQRSLDGFSLLFQQKGRIEAIFLCGGGAGLPSLADFLTKNVGVRIDFTDPFQGWNIPAGRDHHLYFGATGLALYGGVFS